MKALPLALLFDWGDWCSKRGQQNTHCSVILPLPQLLRPISKTCQGEACVDRLFGFISLKTHHAMLGQSPASELGIKEEMKFKHKCNNKNQHKASLRTEREITWSEGGTLPLSYFLIPFQIIFPSSSPLPGASRSMQHSHEEQPSDSPTLPRDQLHPGHTCRLPRETRFLEGLMVREAQVAANRRLWLIICSHLMGEENKPIFFVPVLLFLLFRDCHYQSGTTSPVTSCCFWNGREGGARGCAWQLRLISQAAGRRRWP